MEKQDVFELAEVNAAFKIKGKEYQLHDPVFEKKVMILKGFEDARNMPRTTTDENLAAASRMKELEREYIRVYLPDLPQEVLTSLGERATSTIFEQLSNLAGEKFGAYIQKVEVEKKHVATTSQPVS